MTEEIIIFEQDGNIVGITKEGKYFESYKTTENVAILRGAGLYIKRLEQENKELKETIKQYCEWLDEERESNDKLQKVYQNDHCDLLNYRSALEEINKIAEPRFVNGLNEEADLCNLAMDRIQNKIKEVLND